MSTTCPVCGGRFRLLDRLAQSPVCQVCEKSGVKAPRSIVRVNEARTDLMVGRVVMVFSATFAAFVAVQAKAGSSGAAKVILLGFALAAFGAGLAQATWAARILRHNRE